jgi:hypothetical protein
MPQSITWMRDRNYMRPPAGVEYMKMIDALTKPEADAMRDDFGEKLLKMKGSVDPTLKLGF